MSRKHIRLEDLAEIAGVSIATVSRALNGHPNVNEQTKLRIWKLAKENNYKFLPSMPVSLTSAAATITIVVPTPQGKTGWIRDPFFLELIGGIGEAARAKKCDFLVSHVSPNSYEDLAQLLDSHRTDGVIFLGQSILHDHLNRLAMTSSSPFIVWGAELPGQLYCSVGSDNLRGGRRATRQLTLLGRKRIMFLGEQPDAPEVMQRFQGYKEALREAGLPFDEALVVPAEFEAESAQDETIGMVQRGVKFDAIFAASDTVALGAIRGLHKCGLSVPGDIAVIGYDNIMMGEYSTPSLTSVTQDLRRAGEIMVSRLLGASSPRDMASERLDTDVILRESCGQA